ncbi:hypothetical protein KBTX_03115 [wastewater metagenome]|uniref:Uncharacterized protein n=2 Tax=unclassified sequences TaxID=12908 RepID=A0A5B8RH12_9ZZZZ|nr:hypothetical protein [Arhodomonas sp. KWT]QEA06774.1 hypothetical protein KBTEX_03115 [uncultured organism]
MSYLDEFIESMRFAADLSGAGTVAAHDFEALRNYYRDAANNQNLAKFVQGPFLQLAKQFISNTPYNVADQCHSVSQQFFDRCHDIGIAENCGLAITVGNIEFKGREVYPTSREHVASTLETGFSPDSPLDLHVWITTVNMFVLDLTVIPTLLSKGLARPKDFKGKEVLVAKHGIKKSLRYRPILHDDRFMYKVDRIAGFA